MVQTKSATEIPFRKQGAPPTLVNPWACRRRAVETPRFPVPQAKIPEMLRSPSSLRSPHQRRSPQFGSAHRGGGGGSSRYHESPTQSHSIPYLIRRWNLNSSALWSDPATELASKVDFFLPFTRFIQVIDSSGGKQSEGLDAVNESVAKYKEYRELAWKRLSKLFFDLHCDQEW